MKKILFSKLVLSIVVLITVLVIGIKVYSKSVKINMSDNNFKEINKIDLSKTNFNVAIFGDNKNSHKVFKNLINTVNNDSTIDFAIGIGDFVYDGEKEKFQYFLEQFNQFNIPHLTVTGNHDISEEGRSIYYQLFGPFYYSFNFKNSYFIFLDNSDQKELSGSQLKWLEDELEKAKNYNYKFVMFHVPLYDPRKEIPSKPLINLPILSEYEYHHSMENKEQVKFLITLFEKYNVTHIYASHIHAYYTGKWGKVPFTIAGGGGAELVGNDPNHDFYHYIKLEVTDSTVSEKVVKLATPNFEIIDRITHNLWIYIYAFFAIHFWDVIILLAALYFILYFLSNYNKVKTK